MTVITPDLEERKDRDAHRQDAHRQDAHRENGARAAPARVTGRSHEWLNPEDYAHLKPSWGVGLRFAAVYFGYYFITLAGALAPLPIAVNILFGVANGLAMALLFAIGHETVHGTFFPGRLGNQILARISLLPHLHSASLWELGHNRGHHRKTNYRHVDYVWAPMSPEEYRAAPLWRRLVERLYRSPFGPAFYYHTEIWFKRMILPVSSDARGDWKRHLPDSVFMIVGGACLIAGIMWAGSALAPERHPLTVFALGVFIPYFFWGHFAGMTFYLQHTHPSVRWYDDEKEWTFFRGAIEGTVHAIHIIRGSRLHTDVMHHTAHHVMPTIPVHRLRFAQGKVTTRYPGAVTLFDYSIRDYLGVMKTCKLYDYRAHQWVNFKGEPTGPLLGPPAADETIPAERIAKAGDDRQRVASLHTP